MTTDKPAIVYFCPRITADNLVNVYRALGREAKGRVAIKLSTGEAGNPNHLSTDVIKRLVHLTEGTIVECNTAYEGRRRNAADHLQTAAEHGFTAIAEVDIMDAEGEVALPVARGRHLKENYVGKNWLDYDFTIVLSHFKGHPMGGFGGALKNVAIGMASAEGKAWIHTAGKCKDVPVDWRTCPRRTTSSSPWPRPASRCSTRQTTTSSSSTWQTTSRSTATAWPNPSPCA